MHAVVYQQGVKKGWDIALPWRHALAALILLVGWTLFLYRSTGIAMVTTWAQSETFSHDFLVPPIVVWLVYRRRKAIAAQNPQPTFSSLIGVVFVAFIWLMGDLAAVNAVTQLALVGLLVLVVPTILGLSIARLIIFPLGFLFFSVPIGEFLLPQFMEWTANFTVLALRLSGIPVYREGLQFVIPSGNWSVIEACSGVRYLIASLTVGTLFAYLNYQSTRRRLLFVVVSIVVPIVANWIRAYMIVMLGHLSGNKLAVGVDHLIYGWLFFGFVIVLMFVIGARWSEPEKVDAGSDSQPSVHAPPATAARLWMTAACLAVLVALPHVALWLSDWDEDANVVQFSGPMGLTTGWQEVPAEMSDFKPVFQNPSAETSHNYTSEGRQVRLYLGYYRHQNYNRKLVSSNNVLVVSKDPQWSQVARGRQRIDLGVSTATVRTAELRGTALPQQPNGVRLLAWQIYWINGNLTASDYVAKAYIALNRLMGRGDASAVIVISTPIDQKGAAEAVLESFLTANYETINELLREKH